MTETERACVCKRDNVAERVIQKDKKIFFSESRILLAQHFYPIFNGKCSSR